MYSVLAIAAVLMSATFDSCSATYFKDCGSKTNQIRVTIPGCDQGNVCTLPKGQTAAIQVEFMAPQGYPTSNTVTASAFGSLFGAQLPFPLPETNACSMQAGVQCPVTQGSYQAYRTSVNVLQSYPSISLVVKFRLKTEYDDQQSDQSLICIQVPVKIGDSRFYH